MSRILLVGSSPRLDVLCQAYEAMGREVTICSVPDGIAGINPSAIIVDELCDEFERQILEDPPIAPPAGVLGLLKLHSLEIDAAIRGVFSKRELRDKRKLQDNPRPYLKRKKGRA